MFLIEINTSFVGYHYWKEAPPEFSFLKNVHRHVFHVKVIKKVEHAERDIEFIDLKRKVDDYIQNSWKEATFPDSCETIAENIGKPFEASAVTVLEDGENGATWFRPISLFDSIRDEKNMKEEDE